MNGQLNKLKRQNKATSDKRENESGKDLFDKNAIPVSIEGKIELLRELHKEINSFALQSLHKAIKAGEILFSIRKGHRKNWEIWAKSQLPISLSTAKRYIRVYKNKDRIPESIDDMTQAYRFLTQSKDKKPVEKELNPEPIKEYPKPAMVKRLLKLNTPESRYEAQIWYDNEEVRLRELLEILRKEKLEIGK